MLLSIPPARTRTRRLATTALAALATFATFAVGTGTAAAGAVSTPAAPPRLLEPLKPCTYDGAPAGARCGTVEVPLDRAEPRRGTTRVGFAFLPRRDQSQPSLGTVVPNPGGPGAPASRFVNYAGLLAPLLDRRDLLLVDPRGIGLSQQITCKSMTDPLAGFSHPKLVAAIGACGRELGSEAGLYGSAAVADDIDAVRQVLGLDRLDLWGDSYGTYLMTVYAARHSEHVQSVVLSGSYPIAFDTFGRDRLDAGLRAIHLICTRTRSCDGDAVMRDLERVAARLRSHPVRFTVATGSRTYQATLDEAALASVVYARGERSLSAALPSALANAAAGDLDPLKRLASLVMLDVAGLTQNPAFSAPAFAAVMCHDYPRAFRYQDPPAVRRADYRRALSALGPAAFGPFSAAGWTAAGFEGADLCIDWPNDPTAGAPVATGRLLPDVPVLVLSGDLDANTPTGAGRETAAQFPHAIFAEVANAGHTPSGDPCALPLAIGFVKTLSADPGACLRTGTPPPVPGRAAVSAEQLSPARAAATPAVRRALGLVGATAEDLVQQNGVVRAWGAADGLRGGRYAADTATPGAITLTAVRVVRDASVSGTLAPGAGQQLTGTLRLSGPGVAPGRLQVRIALGTGAGHATGTLSGHAVDLDFQLEGGR
ncbi:alpha/beta fold hydrolase [Microtetraspora fusca]|uniref:Alpha/beta fold hydrolase n=1 Tax=Microtetraspora fusca TaxID=1997 RepID=A0ABW6VFQ7_MICFU